MENLSILIQGPTCYWREQVRAFNGINDILWVTWDTEPAENIAFIESHGIEVIQISMPETKGYWNLNLQCSTSYYGIEYLSNRKHADNIIKIRSDMIFSNFKKFYLNNKQLFFESSDLIFLGYIENSKEAYLLDYIVAGSIKNMLNFWKPSEAKDFGLPYPEGCLQKRYYGFNPIETKRFPKFFDLNAVRIFWLKQRVTLNFYRSDMFLRTTIASPIRRLLNYKEKFLLFCERYR
ncbi:hypothetical protein [Pedobacter namyangjuensis]|uniref:hypothetical protein n=1 Tax=Pedobacter namyangjuensis TaxID=600626 RepID=UPI000DE492E7|nr:hypothetical protein [Pedobacter namyangjuensis]